MKKALQTGSNLSGGLIFLFCCFVVDGCFDSYLKFFQGLQSKIIVVDGQGLDTGT